MAALASLLPAWIAMAWLVSKAQWFWSNRPDLQFGWIVLMLCGYLIWETWDAKPAAVFRLRILSAALFLAGAGLLFLSQIYQAAFGMNAASLAGLALGAMLAAAGNIHYVFGWPGMRHFVFPFAFLLIAMPMPGAIHNLVVGGLKAKVTWVNVEALNLMGIPARQIGSIIQLPRCQVGVDEACSGILSLQASIMATLFIGYLMLQRMSLRIALLVSGVILAVVGNVIRSVFLSYTANAKGTAALEAFHDTAGWSILIFTAAGVMVFSWVFGRLEKSLKQAEMQNAAAGLQASGSPGTDVPQRAA